MGVDDGTFSVDEATVSRRRWLAGFGLAAGAGGLLAALPGGTASAAPSLGAGSAGLANALAAAGAGLTYHQVDQLAFYPAAQGGIRYIDPITGVGLNSPGFLACPLPLPSGSVVRQLNFGYRGSPVVKLLKRPLANPAAFVDIGLQTLPSTGGAPGTATSTTGLPVTIEAEAAYTLQVFCSAGDTIAGATVGYEPPVQGFVPFTGATPRVYDSRSGAKLGSGEERTIPLGNPGVRGAVLNLTLTQTSGASGYVAVFPANIVWPGNSSQNWFAPAANVANAVLTAVDGTCQIKLRGGENATHVLIDVIGWLL